MKSIQLKMLGIMILSAIILMSAYTGNAEAAGKDGGKCGDKLNWAYDNTTETLTIRGTGDMYDYSVDSEADSGEASGKEPGWYRKKVKKIIIEEGVTRIGKSAFAMLGQLESISIPKSMESVGELAFEYDTSLESIEFPDHVTSIAPNAIAECWGLKKLILGKGYTEWKLELPEEISVLDTIVISEENQKYKVENGLVLSKDGTELICSIRTAQNVIIPEGVKIIDESAFNLCKGLKRIVIPEGVTIIKERAFCSCEKLERISIPDSVIRIEEGAFMYCSSLINLTIGSGLKEWLPHTSLAGCDLLEEIAVSESNPYFLSIEGSIASKASNKVLYYPKALKNLVLPEGTKEIIPNMFQDYRMLESVVIPKGITAIGSGAFKNCKNLKTLLIPDSVTTIESEAFKNCENLNNVTIPDSIISIGNEVFCNCLQLKLITLPKNMELISEGVFNGCTSLSEIILPEKIKEIGGTAFGGCTTLQSITLPEGLLRIGKGAFFNCSALEAIVIPSTVTDIYGRAFYNCGLKSVVIPDTVTNMEEEAFAECNQLSRVSLSKGLASIKAYTFNACSALSEVEIKKGTKYIGYYAFAYCPSLKEITIPETVMRINNGFSNGTQLIFAGGIAESQVSIISIAGENTRISLEWNNIKDASGYQITYSNRKDFKKAITVEVKNITIYQNNYSLRGKRKYYIKIRAFQDIDGKRIYGKWSDNKAF